ncbi:Thiol:disulfide interchange protein CycY [bacterium HR38]|nr:Thiol:disulfide interchange protein CycY [bacterium HR38]
MLNFWASWCYPACYEEAPVLEATWRRYRDQVLFVGINTQDKEGDALRFIEQFGLTFPQVFDPRGRVGVDYGMYGVPETFVIDREGRVVVRHAGAIDQATLEQYLKEVLP